MNKISTYQVCATNGEVYVRIKDKASYLNCAPLKSFLKEMLETGVTVFVVDFKDCSSMDSTFLGILVGIALQLRKSKEGGNLTLVNLLDRNLETVKNLGIHKIANVSSECFSSIKELEELDPKEKNTKACSEIIYKAHKTLMELNDKNSKIFKDVVSYLQHKVEDSA